MRWVYLYFKCDEYIEYKRGKNFERDHMFRIFTMVDADLGGDHTRGANGNSVMAGVCFLNESHCYSYSKTIKAICMATHHTDTAVPRSGNRSCPIASRP